MLREINKKNMRNFARTLMDTKNGVIYYKPLCADVIENKKGLHCILGEMHEYFFGYIEPENFIMSPFSCPDDYHADLTDYVVEHIVENAKIKNREGLFFDHRYFRDRLDYLIKINDFGKKTYYTRAKELKKEVLALAKLLD